MSGRSLVQPISVSAEAPASATLLRIVLGKLSRHRASGETEPGSLCEAIVASARAMELAVTTVRKGSAGHRASCSAAEDLPIVIEIIGARERIERFLPVLEEMMTSGLVTTQEVRRRRSGLSGSA